MTVFERYATIYDDIYETKDYPAECDFLEKIFKKHHSGPVRTILDAGCGTGGHCLILASRGYTVDAVDRSIEMLNIARSKPLAHSVTFHQGDLRGFDLGKSVDVVVAMFAVMSYMTANHDLFKAFETCARHLKPGGLFVFDSWFGPAVYRDPLEERMKEINRGDVRIIRFTQPELDPIKQVVAVKFKVMVIKDRQVADEFDEVHVVRPLFVQEVVRLGEETGLELVEACPFMKPGEPLDQDTWSSCFVLRRR